MSLEFDLYLQPCSNGIDPLLAHVYAPIVKPLYVVNGNRSGNAGDEACCLNNDIAVGHQPSDKCDNLIPSSVSECQQRPSPSAAASSIHPASSNNQLTSSDKSSTQCVWSCGYDGEEQSWFVKPSTSVCDNIFSGRWPQSNRASTTKAPRRSESQSSSAHGLFRKLSLPARLTSLTDLITADSLPHAGRGGLRRSQTSFRRRYLNSCVKFADEVGENLTTFAIIPSRFDDPPPPPPQQLEQLPGSRESRSSNDSSSHHKTTETAAMTPCRHSWSGDVSVNSTCFNCVMNAFSDSSSSLSSSSSEETLNQSWTRFAASASSSGVKSVDAPTFHMSFEQPAADLDTFLHRLNVQCVCLENVKVIQSEYGGGGGGRGGGGSLASSAAAVLCTVKVKHLASDGDSLDGCSDRRVFARWTVDDWQSYADISAHCISRSGSASSNWSSPSSSSSTADCIDAYSFAVHLLLGTPSSAAAVCGPRAADSPNGGGYRRRKHGGASSSGDREGSRSLPAVTAVEFALCYAIGKRTYWDNNNNENYRIEWR